MAVMFQMSFVIYVHVLLLLGCSVRSSRLVNCQHGFFYDTSEEECKKCSECPSNQIIQTPCSNVSDVKCEPFSLTDFKSSNSGNDELKDSIYHDLEEEVFEDSIFPGRQDSLSERVDVGTNQGPATVEKGDREYWKKLALALIGTLSVLIVVATVIVIIAWAKVHKSAIVKLPENGDTDDADSGYVVIRSIRHMALPRSHETDGYRLDGGDHAHPPLLQSESTNESSQSVSSTPHQQAADSGNMCYLPKVYKPQRRLLNYDDADDVFDSDDNNSACAYFKRECSPAVSRHPRVRR